MEYVGVINHFNSGLEMNWQLVTRQKGNVQLIYWSLFPEISCLLGPKNHNKIPKLTKKL